MIHWFKPRVKVRRRRSGVQASYAGLLLFSISRTRGIEGQRPHQAIAVAVMRARTLWLGSSDALGSGASARTRSDSSTTSSRSSFADAASATTSSYAASTATTRRTGRTNTTTCPRVAITAVVIPRVGDGRRAFEAGSTSPVIAHRRCRRGTRSVPTLRGRVWLIVLIMAHNSRQLFSYISTIVLRPPIKYKIKRPKSKI